MIITWEELENITGRSKAILSLVSKSLFELPDVCEDGLSVDRALKLLFKMGSFDRSQKNELLEVSQKLEQKNAELLQYAAALEIVKAERHQLEDRIQSLELQSASDTKRAETAEARLHEVTQSFAYLIERKSQSEAVQSLSESKKLPPLLLLHPIRTGDNQLDQPART
ncbi:hypothetical protein PFRI_15850 [Planktotalea frisia]|jgi:septal ring factor EnvC (AmiA/AmiB activator)|uniref:Chromosome partition protein Smc n=1 Tax=Planktotalea frisia TaxID=696762 RepID=A0A1L9NY18_9RHOB|nr:hypothetical protein [Planktotalea frisia]OJI94185.1 hypothetical protein PFRI_15850 [Planktotalea frisia]